MARINNDLEKKLWDAAVQLWSHGDLKPSEYTMPVLGLIFLKYADYKFESLGKDVSKIKAQAQGAIYLQEKAKYSYLMTLSEQDDIGGAINEAMKLIEKDNMDLAGVLPKNYGRIDKSVLLNLLKNFNSLVDEMTGDVFGQIYEYFLGNFHKKTGEKGGEFFTPTSIVKLIVEVIEPYHGRILDPACGSGGMFVQSAAFVERHKKQAMDEIAIYGQELVSDNVNIIKMNLAVHGLAGDIKQGNSYYNDIHKSVGRFDFVMANPPFNSKGIDKKKLNNDPRFPFGLPKGDNGNYVWIQIFHSALNDKGRAGFVMANSASDAGSSEKEIRKQLIDNKSVDVIIAIDSNFFHTVTLPCTLWFFDKGKKKTDRQDKVLFLDARGYFKQIDKAHREFEPEHIQFFGDIVRLYRGEKPEFPNNKYLKENFPKLKYQDIKGLCKLADIKDIEEQDFSLNPGRYVGIKPLPPMPKAEFERKMKDLSAEFIKLSEESKKYEKEIVENLKKLEILE